MRLRLPFIRPADPVLTDEETRVVHDLIAERIASIQHEVSQHRVSASVLRECKFLEDALPKFRASVESMR